MSNVRGRPARRRGQVLDYVRDTIAKEGVAPSYGMICSALGIHSRTEVCQIVKRLEQDRHVQRVGSGKVRRIRLISHTNQA